VAQHVTDRLEWSSLSEEALGERVPQAVKATSPWRKADSGAPGPAVEGVTHDVMGDRPRGCADFQEEAPGG
jgi:hypothetical protein